MRDTERESGRETQAEGEAGSMQGVRCGTQSRVSRIAPWAEGGTKPLSHPGCPTKFVLKYFKLLFVWWLVRLASCGGAVAAWGGACSPIPGPCWVRGRQPRVEQDELPLQTRVSNVPVTCLWELTQPRVGRGHSAAVAPPPLTFGVLPDPWSSQADPQRHQGV